MPSSPPYRIDVRDEARRSMRKLPGNVRQRFRRAVRDLAEEPRPAGSQELRDHPGYYRLWIDRYRLVWLVKDDALAVVIVRAGLKEGPEFYQELPEV